MSRFLLGCITYACCSFLVQATAQAAAPNSAIDNPHGISQKDNFWQDNEVRHAKTLRSSPLGIYVVQMGQKTGRLIVAGDIESGTLFSCFSPSPKKFEIHDAIVAKFKYDGLKYRCVSGYAAVTTLAKAKQLSPIHQRAQKNCLTCGAQAAQATALQIVTGATAKSSPAPSVSSSWNRTGNSIGAPLLLDDDDIIYDDPNEDPFWDEFDIIWGDDDDVETIGDVAVGDIPRCTATLNNNLRACGALDGPGPLKLVRVLCTVGALALYWACIALGP